MNISNEVKVGILTIIAAVILYFGFNFLKGKNLLSKDNYYVVVYDRVEGLKPGNLVMLNGLQVGMVESAFHDGKATNKVVANLSVNSRIAVPKNTLFQITAADLLGEMQVDLVLPPLEGREAVALAESGDTLKGNIEVGMMDMVQNELLPVKDKVQELVTSVDTLVGVVNDLVSSNRVQKILEESEATVSNLRRGSSEMVNLVSSQKRVLSDVLNNTKVITDNLVSSQDQIKNILANVEIASAKLNDLPLAETTEMAQATILQAKSAMAEAQRLLEKVDTTSGTIGMLLNDNRLYENMNATAADLDKLLVDMRDNPKSYVHFSLFGRKDKRKKKDKDD